MQNERNEQIHFIHWLRAVHPSVITIISPIVKYGGNMQQRLIQGRIQKLMGYMPGTLDIFIPEPREPYYGLFIELKAAKGKVSPEQKQMREWLEGKGYYTAICFSCDEAIEVTTRYLNIK